jgi:hypothetical protein
VDPRAGLDDVEKRTFLTLLELRSLGRPENRVYTRFKYGSQFCFLDTFVTLDAERVLPIRL